MHFKPKISTSNGGQENNNQHTRIRINDYEIDEVKETKFLRVTIDNKLTWLPHLKLLAKKLRCCSGQLNRIKNFLPTHLYKNLYHTLFESHLSYAISVWGGVSEAKINPLFIAQNTACQYFLGIKKSIEQLQELDLVTCKYWGLTSISVSTPNLYLTPMEF